MNAFAKIEYYFLSKICLIRTWYKSLTDIDMMKFVLGIFFILFLFMVAQGAVLKNELYEKQLMYGNLKNKYAELEHYSQEQDSVINNMYDKKEQVKHFVKHLFNEKVYKTKLTGYHPLKSQTDDTPNITADGTVFDIKTAGDYRYVALSRDLLKRWGGDIRFGDFVLIKGTPSGNYDGIYQVRDTMNERYTQWIDILLTPGQKSFFYRNILMYKIDSEVYYAVLKEFYDQKKPG